MSLHSSNNKKYLTLDFGQFTPAGGLKPVIDGLKRHKIETVEAKASNRAGRTEGMKTKRAMLGFDNGQSVTITISEKGDIVQTKLNSAIIPMSDLDTVKSYVDELAAKVKANQARFDKRRNAAVNSDDSKTKPASKTVAKQIEEVKATLTAASKILDERKTHLSSLKLKKQNMTNDLDTLKSKLDGLKSEQNQLIEAIEALGGTV